jgi:antitoxin VapB
LFDKETGSMLELAEDTAKLAELVAEKTGKSPDQVVREAVEASARAVGVVPVKPKLSREELIAGMKEIVARVAAAPVYDKRKPDEIIGYDENGLPT